MGRRRFIFTGFLTSLLRNRLLNGEIVILSSTIFPTVVVRTSVIGCRAVTGFSVPVQVKITSCNSFGLSSVVEGAAFIAPSFISSQ